MKHWMTSIWLICILPAISLLALGCAVRHTAASVDDEDDADDCYEVPDHDFSVAITGDTAYFDILDDNRSVSLVYWGRSNFDNPVIEVPATVEHQGKEYSVVEIGNEAMGVTSYGEKLSNIVWCSDSNKVKRIILPTSVKRVGNAAFTGRFRHSDYVVQLTDSVEYLGDAAVDCMTICDENYAVVLPANIREVGYLSDAEDHEIDGEYCDFYYSKLCIPEHLEYIGDLDGFGRDQPRFKRVEVHPRNKYLKTIDGVLYSYDLDSIYWSTMHEDLFIPRKLRVDKTSISFLEDGWYPHIQMPKLKTIVVEKGNPYCVAIDNVLYDIKNRCLIMAGGGENNTAHVPAWCNSVRVLYGTDYRMPQTFVFSNEASQADVDNFISDLLKSVGGRPYTFVYRGKTWSHTPEL